MIESVYAICVGACGIMSLAFAVLVVVAVWFYISERCGTRKTLVGAYRNLTITVETMRQELAEARSENRRLKWEAKQKGQTDG